MKRIFKTEYFKWGLTAFCVLAAVGLLILILVNLTPIKSVLGFAVHVSAPFIYGAIIAYILRPVYNGCRKRIIKLCAKADIKSPSVIAAISNGLSVVISVGLFLSIILALFMMLIPQLVTSVYDLVVSLPAYTTRAVDWVNHLDSLNLEWKNVINQNLDYITQSLSSWFGDTLLPQLKTILLRVSAGLVDMAATLFNIFIGIIVCVYILLSKSTFAAQAKKISFAVFRKETANNVLKGARFVDRVFTGYVTGNIIDAIVIGAITVAFMSIFKWPFPVLVGTIVGVTNLIPFFGPFIGAIPSAILILTVSPIHSLYFIIFILVLQQVDGNIIKPKVFSQSVDLPSFWTLFAIIAGGGMFGLAGVILGVPVFTIIYSFVRWLLNRRLKKKELPFDTETYDNLDGYDTEKGEFAYLPENYLEQRKSQIKEEKRRRKAAKRKAAERAAGITEEASASEADSAENDNE